MRVCVCALAVPASIGFFVGVAALNSLSDVMLAFRGWRQGCAIPATAAHPVVLSCIFMRVVRVGRLMEAGAHQFGSCTKCSQLAVSLLFLYEF